MTTTTLAPEPANAHAIIAAFLALPYEALPAARFSDDSSWAHDAWDVLHQAAHSGESVTALCGTSIILSADRHEWRDVEVL